MTRAHGSSREAPAGEAPAGEAPAGEAPAGPMPGPVREARLAAARDLAAALTHEVNNALNPILAAAFLLDRRADDPAAVREYARRIVAAAEGCAAGVTRLGRFVRQEPPADGHVVPFDLATLAARVLAERGDGWRAGGITIDAALAPGATTRGLPDDARAALLRVVDNAIEAMPTGGRLAVTTGVAPTGSPAGAPEGASANGASANGGAATAWIEVRDTGPGMDPELRDRAFEPYVTTKATRGAGLGLAEAYGVMCRHRGRIELDTMPGRGTVVRLVFPHVPPSARGAAPGAAPGTAPGDPV